MICMQGETLIQVYTCIYLSIHIASETLPSIPYDMWEIELYPFPAELSDLNFHPLEVVSRYREPLQVGGNYSYLFNLRPNIYKA